MFLSNWLVFKIVLAALGLVDYPLAADVLLVYDNANKLYLSGGSLEYVSNVVLYKGETSYDASATVSGDAPLSKTILGGGASYYLGSGYGGPRSFNVNNGDQTVLVAGARGYNSNQGLIYIYERHSKNRGDWELKQTIYGNLGTNASFGVTVSINDAGDRIFVGADQYSSYTGRVLIYDRGSDGLFPDTPTHTLTGSNGGGYVFGFSIDCNSAGDKLIVGARNEPNSGGRGAHHLYELIDGTWTRTYHRVEGSNDRRYGWAVAMNKVGDRFVVGGSYPNGWIWIFHYENGSWVQKTQISNPVASNEFGWSVSMNDVGDRVAVGCNTNRVYIYDYNGTSWSLFTSKTDNIAGYALASLTPRGDYIAIHNHAADPFGTNPGAAYIYKISDTGTLTLVRTFTGEASNDNLGWHVYMSDDLEVIVMGAQGNDEGGTDAGKLYVYSFDTWAENFYITQPGTYRADLQICGIDYKTNEVEVTGTPSDIEVFKEPETDFTASKAVLSSTSSPSYHQGGMSDNGEYYYYGQQVYKKDTGSFTYTTYGSALSSIIFSGSHSSISHDGNYIVSYYTNSTHQLHIIKNNGSTFTSHQIIASPNSSARSDSQPQFIPGPLKHFVWIEKVSGTSNITFHFYKYNSGTDTWSLGFSVTNPTDLSVGVRVYGRGGMSFSKDGNYLAISTGTGGTTQTGVAVLKVDWVNETCVKKYENTSVGYWACFLSRDAKYFYYSTGTGTTAGKMLYSANGDWESTPTDVTSSFTNIGNLGDHSSVFSDRYIFSEKGGSAIYIFKWQDLISPTLTFDNYNKLSLTNTPTYTSSKLFLGSNVYDIGTLTSDITIEKQGEYASLTFDTSSNVAYFSNVTVASVSEKVITDGYLAIDTPVTKFTTTKDIESNTKSISYGTWMNFSYRATSGYTRGFITPTSGSNPLSTTQGSFWDLLAYISSPSDGIFFRNHQDIQFLSFTRDGGDEVPTFLAFQGRGQGHNNFQHVTIVTEDDNGTYYVTLYVNGDKIAKKNISASSNYQFAVRNFTMGKVAYSGSSQAPVSFLRPFLYDGTLSDTDVKKVFLGNVPKVSGSGAKLKCYFPEGLTDVSGNSNDLVAYDTATANFTNHRVVAVGVTPNMDNIMTCNPLTGNGEHTMNVYFDNKMFEITAQSRENSASTTGTHFSAANTFDPRKSSNVRGWCTSAVSNYGGFPHYLSVKFPEAKYVSNCFIIEADPNGGVHRTNSNHLVTGFTIDASTDGTSWSTKYTSSSGIGNSGKQFDLTSPGTFQYWRLGITGSSVDYFGIGFWDIISNNFSVDGPSATSLAKFSSDLTSAPTSASTTGTITYSSDGAVHAASSSLVFPFTVDTADTFSVSFIGKGMSTSQSGFIQSTANSSAPEMEGILAGSGNFWVRPCNYSIQEDRGKSPGYMNNSDWTHYVYTLSPCGYNLYINGVLRLAKLFNSARGGTTGITTFNVNTSNMFNANGILGKFKAYSNVLDYHQVTELYHADTPGISDLLVQPDPITFDGYNKLTFTGADTDSTYKLKYESNTYDLGTISNVYIAYPGTYSAEIKGATNFALSSNVVNQIKLPDVVTVDWSTTSLSSITASNGDTLTTNVGGTWDVQTDSTMGKMVHIQTATTSRKFEIENSTQSLTSFVGTGDGVTISFYMKPGNRLYGSPKWFNDLFRVNGNASVVPNVYAQVTYDTGQTYSVTNDEWMYVQISYKWDGSNFVDYTFYIIDENGDQEVKVSKSNVTTNNGLQSSNKFWETNNKWFNMEVASFRGDINLDFYLTNFRFENKYRSESYWKGLPPSTTGSGLPSLTFDTYNKLTFTGLESGSTSTLKYGSNTYDIGTASNVYISEQGTYEAESKGTTTFALTKNVVGAIASTMAGYEKQDQVLDAGTNAGYSNGDASQGGYGNSIDMSADGTRMVVGNGHYTDSNGRVWLYHLENGSWVLKQTWDGGTRLGSQVAMNEAGTRAFAIYTGGGVKIWDYSSGAWDTSASGTYAIIPGTISGEVPAVDCNKAGDVVIIGSGNSAGTATWIYRLSGGSWSSEKNFSRRGSGVSMNGDGTRCFMGDRNSHKVWESNYSGGSWGTETEIISESSFSGYWPASLSTDSAGETVCIKGGDSGNGAIYERAGNGSWSASVSGILSRTEVYGTDKVALSYDGTVALFGHMQNTNALSTGGHALLYTKSGSTWTLTQTLLNPSSSQDSSDFFGGGTGLAKTVKDRFVVAAMGDDNAGTNYGAIYTYTNAIPKYLDFDTYNKLSINGITPTSTTLKYGSNTYEIGTATNIYVENTGDYSAEIGNATDFVLTNTTVSGTLKTIEPTLSGGNAYLHALSYDGKLYAWGINDDGELGLGDNTNRTTPTLYSGPLVSKILNKGWSGGNTRNETSWIKTVGNEVYATGKGDTYMIPGTTSDLLSFTDVTSYFGDQSLTSNNVVFVGGGERSCVSLTESGNVWTWGTHNSTYWNLGQGTGASSSNTPKQITFGGVTDNISRVAFGHDHGVALDTDGDVWFWGQIWAGGASVDYPQATLSDAQKSPHEIMTSNNIVGVSSTYFTIYAWQSDGTYYALGQDSHGQIGDGAASGGYTSWQKVEYFSANNITINEIYTGQYNVFVDTSDGYYCWGYGASGAFGNGGTGDLASPTKWTNVSNIKVFSAGGAYMGAAITEDGKYYAWGSGSQKQRGDNDTGNISYPKHIDTLPNILAPSFEFDGYDKVFVNDPLDRVFAPSTIPLDSAFGGTWVTSGWSVDAMTHTSTDFIYKPTGGDSGNSFKCNKTTFVWADNSTGGTPSSVTKHGGYVYCADGYDNSGNYNASNFTTLRGRFLDPFYGMSSINTKYTKDTHTYDANQAQIVTVSDPGTYDAQIKSGTDFTLKSETVPATSSTGLYTWAFHHGNFDNAYGDGDILTARDNGRFYADTPSYTGDIGTITAVNPLVSSNVSFRLNEYTQNDSSDTNTTGIMLTEIDVFDDTNTAMTYGTDYRADLYRAAFADNSGDGGTGKLSDETTPYNDDGSRLNDDTLHGSGGYIGWVNGTYNASATGLDRKYPYSVDDELIRLVPLTGKIIGKVQFAYKGTGTTPGWKVYRGDNLIETTNYAGTDINTQGNQTTHQIADTVSSTTYTFTPASALTANVLMVAGGGGGGGAVSAGAAGAGGLVYTAGMTLSGTKTIVVGNGGEGGYGATIGTASLRNGLNGSNTSIDNLIAIGGGGGAGESSSSGASGGSGGGGRDGNGGSGTSEQGNDGGSSNTLFAGGGGGGAGGTGGNGSSSTGGAGGTGLNYSSTFGTFYGDSGWFASGGGGGGRSGNSVSAGTASSGGGASGTATSIKPNNAQKHTGGGGGGAGYDTGNSSQNGGSGGSGIVLLQTNVATPNANSEVKIPEPHCHVLIEKPDDTQFSHLPSLGNNSVHTGGSIVPNIPRADGSVSNVYYASSYGYFLAAQAGSLVSTVEGIFYPIQQERYDNILEIGHNSTNDVELEMASDGTAKLYRNNGANLIVAGTKVCFTVGKWHHIALTLDSGGNAVGYVNGYPVVSATYASAKLPLAREQMCLYRTGVTATFRKFLMYYFKTYNSVLNHKQIMQLAGATGLGPKLEYDGLNAINVVNTEPGSGTEITIYESNVNDTSNLYVVSCNESSYLLSNAGTYYAQIKGTDTFTITRPLTVTDDHFPLYQYPPVVTGTKSSLTTSLSADTWSTWTMSGASTGNGQYQAKTSHATNAPGGTHATAAGLFTNGVKIEIVTDGGASIYSFLHTSQLTNFDITLQLPSAKIIRKYVLYPADTNAPVSTPGGSVDPTLPGNGSEENTRRPKSWVLKGSNDATSWTDLDTVTNQPPSIYGDVHSISSPASYQYYQLSISANNGSSSFIILGEWQLWGDA